MMNRRLILMGLVAWAATCAAAARAADSAPLYRDVYLREEANRLVFGNAELRLEFDRARGDWLGFYVRGLPQSIIAAAPGRAVDFRLGETWMMKQHGATLLRHEVSVDRMRRGVTLRFVLGVGRSPSAPEYELTSTYTLFPAESRVERALRVVRKSGAASGADSAAKLESFLFELPGVALGEIEDCVVDVPGPFFPNTFVAPATPYRALANAQMQFHSAPEAGFGLLAISNRRRDISLGVWLDTAGEVAYRPGIAGDGTRLTFAHENYRAYRLPTGASVDSDVQRIDLARGELPAVLAAYRRVAQATMPLAPAPAWAREMVILEVYPQYYAGGIKGLTAKLPFYRDVGFNTIYLMPHWVGGYSPIDLFTVDPKLGTSDDLKAMVAAAHALGMRVLFDMVIHGFNEKSPLTRERPDLFVHDEAGNLARHPTWKSVTTDWAGENYQRYMVDVVRHDLKTYDIDGYRVDAATYKGPSWDPHLPYPAYRSGSAAPELMRRMLDAMRESKPEAVLLSEVFGPVFYSVCNLVHDNQTEAPQFFLEKMEAGEVTAAHYKAHLANVLDALPAGANRVYYARNHDTSWFYHFGGYTPRFLAMEAAHAFFAIPEVFAGDPKHGPSPDEDPKVYDYYRKLFAARRRFPALTRGEVLLREAESDNDQVLIGLRRLDDQLTLVAISFSDKNETARVNLKTKAPTKLKLTDPISGETIEGQLTLKLKPFQILIGQFDRMNMINKIN